MFKNTNHALAFGREMNYQAYKNLMNLRDEYKNAGNRLQKKWEMLPSDGSKGCGSNCYVNMAMCMFVQAQFCREAIEAYEAIITATELHEGYFERVFSAKY